MSSEHPPPGERDEPTPVRESRYRTDRYPSGNGAGQGFFGAILCGSVTVLIGLVATPFNDSIFLWLLILPGLVAPVVGFLLWIIFHNRQPWTGIGAVIFGTLSFLVAATCYMALTSAF